MVNGENYHVLQLLAYLYPGQIDCIYIDPPYNTGARDWKYNNRYVDNNDVWRHSKWLSMMERRLRLAKRLLKPDAVLICTIDENEVHHLGMLLERIFPEARMQMVSVAINPAAVARAGYFGRADEYYYFLMFGRASVKPSQLSEEWITTKGRTHRGEIRWDLLRRSGSSPTREGHPETFYPFFITEDGARFHSVGEPIGVEAKREDTVPPEGTIAVWPIRQNGSEGRWRLKPATVRKALDAGYLRIGELKGETTPIYCLAEGEQGKITNGTYTVEGRREDGSVITSTLEDAVRLTVPGSQWRIGSHDSTQYGTRLLLKLMPDRQFPYPKSLYAVEDALRLFLADKPDALVMDFFGGSGTTAHAVFRLNKQDGGMRRSVTVTNNEVSADEAESLRRKGFKPGDPEWESRGIFEFVTRPRITAAVTGETTQGKAIEGDYKFTDEFPMADGFLENVEFFRIDYLDPDDIDLGTQFDAILPALWLAAGGRGSRETGASQGPFSLPIGSTYGVLFRESAFRRFREELLKRADITCVWLVTDSEDAFAEMCSALPRHLRVSMLYRDYLLNFRVNARTVQ